MGHRALPKTSLVRQTRPMLERARLVGCYQHKHVTIIWADYLHDQLGREPGPISIDRQFPSNSDTRISEEQNQRPVVPCSTLIHFFLLPTLVSESEKMPGWQSGGNDGAPASLLTDRCVHPRVSASSLSRLVAVPLRWIWSKMLATQQVEDSGGCRALPRFHHTLRWWIQQWQGAASTLLHKRGDILR
jgi:hypothetical protein